MKRLRVAKILYQYGTQQVIEQYTFVSKYYVCLFTYYNIIYVLYFQLIVWLILDCKTGLIWYKNTKYGLNFGAEIWKYLDKSKDMFSLPQVCVNKIQIYTDKINVLGTH